jgi:hypothetical protein
MMLQQADLQNTSSEMLPSTSVAMHEIELNIANFSTNSVAFCTTGVTFIIIALIIYLWS